ncbi:MAG: Bax inhibitor-1/YccA family protein [Ruminococcus sp.]|nr:Bax inhibitor-1/YccA family protein [Ruminococcus sp.]
MNRLNNQQQTGTKQKKSFFRSNPVMNRLSKVNEFDTGEKAAGYGRITIKTAYFLLMTVVGMFVYLIMNSTIFASQPQTISFAYKNFVFNTSTMQIGFFAGAAIIAIITQILAAFVRSSIPVTGTIYSVCQGFIISFIIFTVLGNGYSYLGLLALLITIVVVFSMALLYTKGIIKPNKKFHMIVITLFASMIGISILSFFGYLIPLTRPFVAAIMGNFWVSIGLTVISIILACLFLISDFAMIDYVVENKMPAKYEWMASFGLAFTVLWIYVKILDLLIQIVGNSKR